MKEPAAAQAAATLTGTLALGMAVPDSLSSSS
jgi:hypothetical protein